MTTTTNPIDGCYYGGVELCREQWCPAGKCTERRYAEMIQSCIDKAPEWAAKVKAGTHEIRSRGDFGGSLQLYRRTSDSPTGVLSEGSMPDRRDTRDALYAQGLTIYRGAC